MTFRVYFNRHREAPQVWSIDEGTQDSEINVKAIVLGGSYAITVYNGEPVNDNSPSAYFEVHCVSFEVKNGIGYFK